MTTTMTYSEAAVKANRMELGRLVEQARSSECEWTRNYARERIVVLCEHEDGRVRQLARLARERMTY